MLVRGEDLDRFARGALPPLRRRHSRAFFKCRRFFGRGRFGVLWTWFWIDQPIAFNASQPRCGATDVRSSSLAILAATLLLDHNPPSGGGSRRRRRNLASSSGLRSLPVRRCDGVGRQEPRVPRHSRSGRAIVRSIARHRPSSPTLARWCDHAPKARLPGSAAMRWHPHIPQTALPTPRHSNDPRLSPCVPISRLMAPKLICFARPCESLSTSNQSAGNR